MLETTAQILTIPPFFENLGKRLIKSPKVYLADPGLACHLLGISTAAEFAKSPFLGVIFEGCVAAEIIKSQIHSGGRQELYHFRDPQGLEVDFLVPGRGGHLTMIESKAGRAPLPAMASPMLKLTSALCARRPPGFRPEMVVLHQGAATPHPTTAIVPGVRALTWKTHFSL